MDHLFALPSSTEDQAHSHEILHIHTAHRTVNALAAVTTVGIFARKLIAKNTPPLGASLLRGNAVAVLLGITGGAVLTELKMQEKAPIEWQDRAWRILQNKGQNEIDVWSAAGATAGFTLFGLTTGKKGGFLVRSLGGVGLGSVIGIASLFAYKKADEFGYVDELKKQWKQAQQ